MIALNIDPDFLEVYAVVQLLQGMLQKETNINGSDGINANVIKSSESPGFFISNPLNDICLIVKAGNNIRNHDKFSMTFGVQQSFDLHTNLPLLHYYTYGNDEKTVVVEPQDSIWLMEGLEEIRTALKNDEVPLCWKKSQKRYHV